LSVIPSVLSFPLTFSAGPVNWRVISTVQSTFRYAGQLLLNLGTDTGDDPVRAGKLAGCALWLRGAGVDGFLGRRIARDASLIRQQDLGGVGALWFGAASFPGGPTFRCGAHRAAH
jgi:hypothetical protein